MTHHQMDSYFSGTDMKTLHDNASSFDMFLSVIVNTSGKKIAKIAFVSEIEHKISYTSIRKLFSYKSKPEKCLSLLTCNVTIKNENILVSEIEEVLNAKKKIKDALEKKVQQNHPSYNNRFYSEPQYTKGYQTDLFTDTEKEHMIDEIKQRGEEIDNDEFLTSLGIENLLVRSLLRDDLAVMPLKDAVWSIMKNTTKNDRLLKTSEIVDHFFKSLLSEYYYDQFVQVVDESLTALSEFDCVEYRFISNIMDSLEKWIDEFENSKDLNIEDIKTDFKELNKPLRFPENPHVDEF